jgi:hypothetical protein
VHQTHGIIHSSLTRLKWDREDTLHFPRYNDMMIYFSNILTIISVIPLNLVLPCLSNLCWLICTCRCCMSIEQSTVWYCYKLGWWTPSSQEMWSLWILLHQWLGFRDLRASEMPSTCFIYWYRCAPRRWCRRSLLLYWQVC